MPRYFDEETGQEVFDPDPDQWNFVYDDAPAQPPEESPGFLDTATAAVFSLPSRIARGVGGAIQAGEELSGYDIPGVGAETVDYANTVQDFVEQRMGIPRQGRARMAYEIAGGLLPAAGSLAMSGGAALPVLFSEGIRGYGDAYQGLRQHDVDPALAGIGAGAETAVNTIAGKIGLDALLGPGKSILGRTLRGTLANVATTPLTTGTRLGVDAATGAHSYSAEEVQNNLVQDLEMNAITGAALGPVAELSMRGRTARPVDTMTVDQLTADMDAVTMAPPPAPETPALPAPQERLGLPMPEYGPKTPDIELGYGQPSGAPIEMGEAPSGIPPKTRLAEPAIIGEQPAPPVAPDIQPAEAYRARAPEDIAAARKEIAEVQTANTLNKIKQGDPKLTSGVVKDLTTPRIVAPDANPTEKSFPRPAADANATTEQPVTKPSLFEDERGFIDLTPLKEKFDSVIEGIRAFGDDAVIRGMPSERDFQGYATNKGLLKDLKPPLLGKAREFIALPSGIAKKHKNFARTYEMGKEQLALENAIAHDVHTRMRPYYGLPDRTAVDKFLAADRELANRYLRQQKDPPPMTEDYLRSKGFNEQEIAAVKSYRDGMNRAVDYIEQALLGELAQVNDPKLRTEYENGVKDYANLLRKGRYTPFSRFGKGFDVTTTDAQGNVLYREFFDSRAEALKASRAQKKAGKGVVTLEEMPGRDPAAYDDFLFMMHGAKTPKEFDPSKFQPGEAPMRGFVKHLAPAALVPGYEKNMGRSSADYVLGLSKYAARKITAPKWEEALSAIDPKAENALSKYAREYRDWINAPGSSVTRGILRLSNFWSLAGVPVSAWTNGTQTLVNTGPALLKYQNPFKAARTMGSAGKVTMDFLRAKATDWKSGGDAGTQAFIKKHGELGEFINEGIRRGTLEAVATHDLSRMRSVGGNTFSKVEQIAMTPFKTVEEMNRVTAFAAGYKAGKTKGLQGEELFKFAEDFTNTTQFDQSKSNIPRGMRPGLARIATQYKGYLLNQMHFLRQHMRQGDYQVVAASVGAQMMLGGAFAVPIMREFFNLAEAGENDPKAAFRKFVKNPQMADALMYGLPTLAGVNVSANVASELVPGVDRGLAGIAKSLAGPTGGLVGRALKAKEIWDRGEPWIAAETAAPRFARGPSKALRAYMRGDLRDYQGNRLLKDPSMADLLTLATGASPQEVTAAYEERHSLDILSRQHRDDEYFNQRIGKALAQGNPAESIRLQQEMIAKGLRPNKAAINRAFLQQVNPDAAALKKLPKGARAEALEIRENIRGGK